MQFAVHATMVLPSTIYNLTELAELINTQAVYTYTYVGFIVDGNHGPPSGTFMKMPPFLEPFGDKRSLFGPIGPRDSSLRRAQHSSLML